MATVEDIDDSLTITEPVKVDNSIEYCQYHEYAPHSQ